MSKCDLCNRNKPEPLVEACRCGPQHVHHYSCLRNKIIATADQKCIHCYQRYKYSGIRRFHPLKTVRDVFRRSLYYLLIFGVFWTLTRQINILLGDYMLAVEKVELQGSARPRCPYNSRDLCDDCQYMFFSTIKVSEDVWMPLSYELSVAFILSAISVIYFRKKFRKDIIQDASTRIVILDRLRAGQVLPKLRLLINKDEVLVGEWDPQRGYF